MRSCHVCASDEGERHLDEVELGDDGSAYTVAGYLNGMGSVIAANGTNGLEERPDGRLARPQLSPQQVKAPGYEQQALVPLMSETHSATDVAAYGQGPSSQLIFGTMEQSWIFHVMLHAFEAPPEPLAMVVQTSGTEESEHLVPVPGAAPEGVENTPTTQVSGIAVGVLCAIVGAAIGAGGGYWMGSRKGNAKDLRPMEVENLVYKCSQGQ